jgi:L-malate glycosyltransferase
MAGKWRILLMVRELGIGGCERDMTKLALALDRSRFEPHVACFRPQGLRTAELTDAGVPILHLVVPAFLSRAAVSAAWRMRQYIRRNRIQLIHAFDVPTDIFGLPVAWASRTPVLISSQLSYRDRMYTRFERLLLSATDRLADRIVVNSEAVERHLIEQGIRPERLYVSHNGVDTRTFFPAPRPRPPGLDGASLVIGSVCALRPEKRIDLLVKAFARVRPLQPDMKLAIVGSGRELPDLEQLSESLQVRADCHFEPARPDVADWMRSIDIFVLSSSIESFPNALLEAMACGCAVIGSRVGGVPELIAHEENGLLFEPGNAGDLADSIGRLIRDPALRARLASAAAETARTQFPIERNVERAEALYQSLLERRRG